MEGTAVESGGLEELPPASVRNSSASVDTDVTQVDTPHVDQVCIFTHVAKIFGQKAMPQSP